MGMYICGKVKCTESSEPEVTTEEPEVTTPEPEVTTPEPEDTTPEVPETYTSDCNIRKLIKRKKYGGFLVVPMSTANGVEYVTTRCKKSVCPLEVPTGTV